MNGARSLASDRHALTAASQQLTPETTQTLVIQPNEWQTEAWNYYHSMGELNFAVDSWLSNCMSRVRLFLALRAPGAADPEEVTEPGPLRDIVTGMAGGQAGQAAMLKRMTIHITVPGDSYLVTEQTPPYGLNQYRTYSNSEIRITGRQVPMKYQVNDQRAVWRSLEPESLVSRVWWPDPQFNWRATSPTESALPILREIDMYNRLIMAHMLSRVASNGILLVPKEVTFESKPNAADGSDPFMERLIEVGTKSVQNPGSAASAFPIPIKVPAQYIEQFKLLTFATEMGDKIVTDRQIAIDRLASTLNMPAEAMKGMGDVNHWGQWQIDETGIKIHISPVAEVIVNALTQTFLQPMAAAANVSTTLPDGSEYIIWYDASALIEQPDRSAEGETVYAAGEITGDALRKTTGFDADDKPSLVDLRYQALLKIAMSAGADSLFALSKLLNDPTLVPPTPAPIIQGPGTDTTDQPVSGPQDDQGAPPEPVDTNPKPSNPTKNTPSTGKPITAPPALPAK